MIDSLLEVDQRRDNLRRWRWYAALVMLIVIVVILLARLILYSDPLTNDNAIYHHLGYWAATVVFIVLTVIHWFQRHLPRQRLSETIFFLLGYAILMYFYWADLRFGNSIYATGEDQRNSAVGTVVWLGLLYIAPFIIWSLRTAIVVALLTYMSIIGLWLYFAHILNQDMVTIRPGDLIHLAITGIITMILSLLLKQMTLLSAQERTMIDYALKDSLTTLPNRLYVDEFLRSTFPRHRLEQRPITLAVCDIDHFKKVNDRFLHAVGDKALQVFAQLLRNHLAESYVVGRYGGEEFVLVFTDTTLQVARQLCEDLRVKIVAHDWAAIHPDLKITASFGVSAITELEDAESFEDLLHHADAKLYQAKNSGRNRVNF